MSLHWLRLAVLCGAGGLGGVQAQALPEDPLQPTAPLMSMQFQNIDLRAAFQVIADFSGLNIVTSDNVTGTASVHLKDLPWEQVLETLLQAKGLAQRRQGNVIWIAPRADIAAREKFEVEHRAALQNLEVLQMRTFRLNYAKASDMLQHLLGTSSAWPVGGASAASLGTAPLGQAHSARLLTARGSAIADARTNQLFVTDVSARLEQVQRMVDLIDIPLRQVMIEARIVEASDSFGKTLGAKLALGDRPLSVGERLQASGPVLSLPAAGLQGVDPAGIALTLYNAAKTSLIAAELSALEANGQGKIVASPRIVTGDQAKAVIEQGTELPYQVASTNSNAHSISFRKANLRLEVTPQITPEGSIVLDLDINKDSVGQVTPAGFAIDTKHISTQVRVDDGGTVVIGGIFELNELDNQAKVPGWGDIPWLGRLFGQQMRKHLKQELMVFITPKMLPQRVSAP
jgi:type IV pilus assembly protein PilQ